MQRTSKPRPRPPWPLVAALIAASAPIACTGVIGEPPPPLAEQPGGPGPGNGGPGKPSCEGTVAALVPMRRMNDLQFANTVRDLFAGLVTPPANFPETTRDLGYSTEPDANIVSQLGAEQILEASEDVALQVSGVVGALLGCASRGDEACAGEFIDTYGRRAFRRTPTAAERDLLLEVYREVRADLSFGESIGLVAATMLQMPQFLYFFEETTASESGVVRLPDHAIATRLAYFLWNTMPDDDLLTAADRGELGDKAGVEAQARRMLADDRAAAMLGRFHREWIKVDEDAANNKDVALYPGYGPALVASMAHELELFVHHVTTDLDGSLDTLLTSRETFVNRALAELYGLDPSVSSSDDDWQKVTLDPSQRAGLLTKPIVLATNAHANTTSPVFRGKLVRTQLLCQDIPAPPPDAMNMLPDFPEEATQRDKSEVLVGSATCGGCHRMMNPVGLGFERYDAFGRWRETDTNGAAVDARGEVVGASGLGAFDGAVELAGQLATSDVVAGCAVRHWFRYTFGKRESDADACTIERLEARFAANGHDIRALVLEITTSDAFAYADGGAVP